jgi:hypothetical protein
LTLFSQNIIPAQCSTQGIAHLFKPRETFRDEFLIKQTDKIRFLEDVKLIDLESLFEQTLLYFDQVPVVPGQQRDLAARMGDFTNYSHFIKA